MTKNIIESLTKLKFIITSGLRNKSIDLDAAKKERLSLAVQKVISTLLQN